jgi:hypothetical protein
MNLKRPDASRASAMGPADFFHPPAAANLEEAGAVPLPSQ